MKVLHLVLKYGSQSIFPNISPFVSYGQSHYLFYPRLSLTHVIVQGPIA